jgi:hypothetical protein
MSEGGNHGRRRWLQGSEHDVKDANMPTLNIETEIPWANVGRGHPETACTTSHERDCGDGYDE